MAVTMSPAQQRRWHNQRYADWRVRALRQLESLGPRVEALGRRFYAGCGFHYDMQKKYEKLHLYLAEDLVVTADNPSYAISHQIVNEIVLEELCKDVAAAEISALQLEAELAASEDG